MKITWYDHERLATEPANPTYPDGVDLDISGRARRSCGIDLPYPASRCGYYLIECEQCGGKVVVTTAGRADDPRSIRFACKI